MNHWKVEYRGFLQEIKKEFRTYALALLWCRQAGINENLIRKMEGEEC
jgi:hypothetical protein